MTDNEPAAPLSAADVERQVRETMVAQQATLLEIAGRNALQLVRDEQKKAAPSLLEAIEGEADDKRVHDNYEWRTNINRDNFNALYEIEQMWKKTERFVGTLEVSTEQAELKASATAAIEKGKHLTHQRLKVLKFADRDGWQAALHFVGDNIAETPEEAKRMKKGIRDAEKERELKAARSKREKDGRDKGSFAYGREAQSSRRGRDWDFNGYSTQRSYREARYCYHCGGLGHIARVCPRR